MNVPAKYTTGRIWKICNSTTGRVLNGACLLETTCTFKIAERYSGKYSPASPCNSGGILFDCSWGYSYVFAGTERRYQRNPSLRMSCVVCDKHRVCQCFTEATFIRQTTTYLKGFSVCETYARSKRLMMNAT